VLNLEIIHNRNYTHSIHKAKSLIVCQNDIFFSKTGTLEKFFRKNNFVHLFIKKRVGRIGVLCEKRFGTKLA